MIQFFIRCEPNSPYFYAVEVHDTEQQMLAAVAKIRGYAMKSDQDIRALCLRYVAEGRNEKNRLVRTGELGTIYFQLADVADDVVVHEVAAHGAIGWAKRARVNPCSRNGEERFARVAQLLYKQTALKLRQSLLWRPCRYNQTLDQLDAA